MEPSCDRSESSDDEGILSLSRNKCPVVHLYLQMKKYIYIIYTPNLGLGIAVFDWEKEQSHFGGSIKQAGESTEGARGSIEGAK